MIKVLQFGEGNFLRTFVDVYFDTLNREGYGPYEVNIVKPIAFGTLDRFHQQNNKYHVVLRGVEDGNAVENVLKVDCVASVIDPFSDIDAFYALALDPELKIVVSNTTEAGICFNENDKIDGFDGITFPAKLTKFLLKRYAAGLPGLYFMPVELIDRNADELKRCVELYADLWNLDDGFKTWNATQNFYCNTLVDRIVSGYPRDPETKAHLFDLIGSQDELVSIGEPFGLWAVEDKGEISTFIKGGKHNVEVVLAPDITYYKKRKVRVLNGSHTNLVPAGLMHGLITVADCMENDKLRGFALNTLEKEINPFVSNDIAATTEFANATIERFKNPFLNHRLESILLNSISKWRARVLPSFKDYVAKYGKLPTCMTVGFSYLMALYSLCKRAENGFTADLPSGTITLLDDKPYLEFFADGGSALEFMSKADVWGEDLTAIQGFATEVEQNVNKIKEGVSLI